MVRATVAFALLFFSCTYAATAPGVNETTLIRDSVVGFDLIAGNKQKKGVVQGDRHLHVDIDEAVDKASEIILLKDVNGTGISLGANIDVAKIFSVGESLLDRIFSVKNPFWRKK